MILKQQKYKDEIFKYLEYTFQFANTYWSLLSETQGVLKAHGVN